MSHTRDKKHSTQTAHKTPQVLAVKAIPVTPPHQGVRAFYFKKGSGKTQGLSPNGKHPLRLRPHEGRSHLIASTITSPAKFFTSDSPVKSTSKNNLKYLENKLLIQLKGLKNRTDSDYHQYRQNGEIDDGHYTATQIKIRNCTALFKRAYQLSSDKNAFLEKYKKSMADSQLYNPFHLEELYKPSSFNSGRYSELCKKGDYLLPILKGQFEGEQDKPVLTTFASRTLKPRALRKGIANTKAITNSKFNSKLTKPIKVDSSLRLVRRRLDLQGEKREREKNQSLSFNFFIRNAETGEPTAKKPRKQ